MTKMSEQIRKLNRTMERANPVSNETPIVGETHAFGTASQIMLTGETDCFIELDFLDGEGQPKRRKISRGVWPIETTRINGWRPANNPNHDLITEIDGHSFQITAIV